MFKVKHYLQLIAESDGETIGRNIGIDPLGSLGKATICTYLPDAFNESDPKGSFFKLKQLPISLQWSLWNQAIESEEYKENGTEEAKKVLEKFNAKKFKDAVKTMLAGLPFQVTHTVNGTEYGILPRTEVQAKDFVSLDKVNVFGEDSEESEEVKAIKSGVRKSKNFADGFQAIGTINKAEMTFEGRVKHVLDMPYKDLYAIASFYWELNNKMASFGPEVWKDFLKN